MEILFQNSEALDSLSVHHHLINFLSLHHHCQVSLSMKWNTVAFPVIPASTVDESDMEFKIKIHLFTVL